MGNGFAYCMHIAAYRMHGKGAAREAAADGAVPLSSVEETMLAASATRSRGVQRHGAGPPKVGGSGAKARRVDDFNQQDRRCQCTQCLQKAQSRGGGALGEIQ